MILSPAQAGVSGRLDALKARHNALSQQLDEESKYPATLDTDIRALKREKLRLKDMIEGIQQASR